MREILRKQGRVEQAGGMRFYEQDIVMLDYAYTGDVTIELELEYILPGFGVIFSENSKGVTADSEPVKSILAKLGSNEFAIYYKKNLSQARVYNETCLLAPDKRTHKLRFMKDGTYVRVYDITNGTRKELGKYNLKTKMVSKFFIGFYSNAKNVLKNVQIYDNRPQHWFANIKNTNGGRVSFAYGQFKVECAEKDIEVEQQKIPLAKGRYFLSYEKEPVDGELIENAYVFPYEDGEIHAPEKSLLKYDAEQYGDIPYFDITKDGMVNLLFQVNSGLIKDLAIKDDWRTDYVPSEETASYKEGSYIRVVFKGLQKLTWRGTIYKIPQQKLTEALSYSVFTYAGAKRAITDVNVDLGEEYIYTIEKNGDYWKFTVKNDRGIMVYSYNYPVGEKDARLFDNISGEITKMTITNDKGEEFDLIFQQTIKKYVPASITSPIIVTDQEDEPLDLSSSFRKLDDGTYWFVNWEREWFKPEKRIELEMPMTGLENVNVYGIRGEFDRDKLYSAKDKEHIHSLFATTNYSLISVDYLEAYGDKSIGFSDELLDMDFDYFIVDYLKDKSYAINLVDDGREYEVEICCSDEKIHTYYDMDENGNIHEYKINNDLKPPDDVYLVLRRNEVI